MRPTPYSFKWLKPGRRWKYWKQMHKEYQQVVRSFQRKMDTGEDSRSAAYIKGAFQQALKSRRAFAEAVRKHKPLI